MSNFGSRNYHRLEMHRKWTLGPRVLVQNLTTNLDQRKQSENLKADQNCNSVCDHKFPRKKTISLQNL